MDKFLESVGVTVVSPPPTPPPACPSPGPESKLPDQDGLTWPTFPLCPKLYGTEHEGEVYLNCISVMRAVGNRASSTNLRSGIKAQTPVPIVSLVSDHEWLAQQAAWLPVKNASPRTDYAVALSQLKAFLTWTQQRTRKSSDKKTALFRKFNIELAPEEVRALPIPVETEVIEFLEKVLPFELETQYRVGQYRLDAFIPRLRLGIHIDEHGHRGYNEKDEKKYDTALRDANIECLRFNPHQKYLHGPALELVRRVWNKTLSPAFGAFVQQHRLG